MGKKYGGIGINGDRKLMWMKYDIVLKLRVVLALCLGKTAKRCGQNMGRNRLN